MSALLRKPAMFGAAIAAAVVLAFGILCASPAAAMADDGAALSAQQELSTQGTVSIPVITKMVNKTEGYIGDSGLETITSTYAIKYNSNGQIKNYKETTKSSLGEEWFNHSFTYNKKGQFVNSKTSSSSEDSYEFTYKLDKKGRVKSAFLGTDLSAAYKYNAQGYVSKDESGMNNSFTWNDDGTLQKTVIGYGDDYNSFSYKYDARGNFKKVVEQASWPEEEPSVITYKNKYNGDLLKKRVEKDGSGEVLNECTFTYKTIEVPEEFAAQVKAQQKWLKFLEISSYGIPPLEGMYL